MNSFLVLIFMLFLSTSSIAAVCNGCTAVDASQGCQVANTVVCNILADGVCKRVSNNSGSTIYVPAKATTNNWYNFYTYPQGGVSIAGNTSCATIASGVCTSTSAGNDACGTACGNGTIAPNCSNSGSVCTGVTHLGSNGCGPCTGTLGPNCTDTNSYCSGVTYTSTNTCGTCTGTLAADCSNSPSFCSGVPHASVNGCGSCTGTQAPVNATWGAYTGTGTYQPHPSGTCTKICGSGTIAAQRQYSRTCNNDQTCGGATCSGATTEWRDEGTLACNTQACAPVYIAWNMVDAGVPDGNIGLYHNSGSFQYWWTGAGTYSGGLEGETMTIEHFAVESWPPGSTSSMEVKINGVTVHSSTYNGSPAAAPAYTSLGIYATVLNPANSYEVFMSTTAAAPVGCPNVWAGDTPSNCYEERTGWCGGKDIFEKCVVGACGTSDGSGCTLNATRGRDWIPWMSHMPCANYAVGGMAHCSTTPRDSYYACVPSQDCATVRANACTDVSQTMDSCNNYCGAGTKALTNVMCCVATNNETFATTEFTSPNNCADLQASGYNGSAFCMSSGCTFTDTTCPRCL